MNTVTEKILNGQMVECSTVEELQSTLSELSEDGILWRDGSKIDTTHEKAAMIFNNGQHLSVSSPVKYDSVILSEKKPNTNNSRYCSDSADPKAILCFECLKNNE